MPFTDRMLRMKFDLRFDLISKVSDGKKMQIYGI